MKIVNINTSKKYSATIAKDLLADCGEMISKISKPCKLCIITDDNVEKLYLTTVKNSLSQEGFNVSSFVFVHGEENKTTKTVSDILEFEKTETFDRTDLIVAPNSMHRIA